MEVLYSVFSSTASDSSLVSAKHVHSTVNLTQKKKDLESEIARYRSAGLTVSDSSRGPIPGTMRASLNPEETFGLGIQLVSYI